MCWMTIHTGPDAIDNAITALRSGERQSGGHSWGLAVALNGEIHSVHGVGRLPDWPEKGFDQQVRENATVCLAHTRYATRGKINVANSHPFAITDESGETVAMLAHNGTWWQAPDDGEHADSWFIARELEHLYRTMPSWPFEELIKIVGRFVGETITVLHRDGRAWAYSGRFDITATEDGRTVASSGHELIPDDELHLAADGQPGEQATFTRASEMAND